MDTFDKSFIFLFLIPFLCLFLPEVTSGCWQGSEGERDLSVSLNTGWRPDSVNDLHLPPCHLPPPPPLVGPLQPPSPSSSNSMPSPHHLTLQLESEDVRTSNRVSAEVIDSSHTQNSPASSVNGAEPESWRVSETCKQSMAELSGRSETHRRVSERENGGPNNCFIGKERSK